MGIDLQDLTLSAVLSLGESVWKGRFTLVGFIQRIMYFPFAALLTMAKRSTSKKYVLGVMAVFLLSGLSACPQTNSHDGPTVTLGIGINLPSGGVWPVAVGADHAVFYVPAVGNGEILGVLVVPKGRFVGIRVIPSVQGDTVKIVVSGLLADKRKLSEATCEEIRSWPSVDAGSYVGKKGASFPLTALGKLGLPVFQMDVVPAKGPPPGGWHHPYANFIAHCSCESTRDELNPSIGILGYPDAEKCTEIGKCGRCCRISLP